MADDSSTISSEDGVSSAHDLLAVETPRTGARIGKYRLVRVLGQGGMGVVYEAVHEEISQRIAVKVMATRLSHRPSFQRRFLREAQASSKVRDAGLVQVFDYGTLPDGAAYIFMEFVEGCLLRTLLKQRAQASLPIDLALRLGGQLAASLQVAHDAGVVHRDIKPENVMLVRDAQAGSERVKILDFGIAKLMGTTAASARPARTPIGTPVYMSPEQCLGLPILDGKSDVYSLAVLLYEMLLGRPPFVPDPSDPQGVVRGHILDTPTPPRQLRHELSSELEQFLLRMLHKSPALRPTMQEVAEQLKTLATAGKPQIGIRFARGVGMVLLLLLLITPFVLEAYYYSQHAELWRPGRRPQMARISGTRFVIGSTQDEVENISNAIRAMGGNVPPELFNRETPERRVSVSDFFIDTYEVTNERYALWLNSQHSLQVKYDRQVYSGDILLADLYPKAQVGITVVLGRFIVKPELRDHPIVQVTWDGAQRYCAYYHKRLPTEAEWELAARGREGRHFPWGDQWPTCDSAVFDWSSLPELRCGHHLHGTSAVGSHSVDRTKEGVYDLGGNVAEWILDYYWEHYPRCAEASCINPLLSSAGKGPRQEGRRVVRGGSWFREFDALRGAGRSQAVQTAATSDIGFRCVRTIEPN